MRTTKKLIVARVVFLLQFITTLCVFPLGTYANEKNSQTDVEHAVRILKNLDDSQSKEWAFAILKDAADNDTNAYAMNAVGLAYVAGVGVEKDSTLAMQWLEKAGLYGYSDAYHNIGMMYKYAKCGIKQNFTKAYQAYEKGAEQGSVVCKYDAGFMLYKGLGCEQDYGKAIKRFEEAAEKEHSPSIYMLGLCYRNGYGVEQDTLRASYYLNRSASLSFSPAIEELMRPYPENYLQEGLALQGNIPESMPTINTEVNDMSLAKGIYQGYMVIYDWSGNYVLAEKPVAMTIDKEANGNIIGDIIIADDTIPYKAKLMEDGSLSFASGKVRMEERYTVGRKVCYKVNKANLDVWCDKIYGALALYSLKEKEPKRPMYIELSHSDGERMQEDKVTQIKAMPNPFSSNFDVTFELSEPAVPQIRIFDKMGIMVYCESLGHLDAGTHTVNVAPNIKEGYYVLNAKVGNRTLRTIIVKKGDE